jgi:hypothetical protein
VDAFHRTFTVWGVQALLSAFSLDILPYSPVFIFVDAPTNDTTDQIDRALRQVQNYRPIVRCK